MAESKKERFRRRRRIWRKRGTNLSLRLFLKTKAALGRWDKRYCDYYGVDHNVVAPVRRTITRAYARGLVPTSTTGGTHAPGSYHKQKRFGKGRAADLGVRRHLAGTTKGYRKIARFHDREYRRVLSGKSRPIELIGPNNNQIVLRGQRTSLGEGTALEQAHDNHVHVAY